MSGINVHDLLPMPYTDESLRYTIERVKAVSEILERPLVLENPSTYLEFGTSTWSEVDFLSTLAQEADCGILLDVNNVYVSCFNHGWTPKPSLTESRPTVSFNTTWPGTPTRNPHSGYP